MTELHDAHEAHKVHDAHEVLRSVEAELKAQAQTLEHLTAAHRAAGTRRRQLVGTLPVAALETDPSGRIVWANSAAAVLFGTTQVRLLMSPLDRLLAEEDRSGFRDVAEASARGEEPLPIQVRALPRAAPPIECDLRPTLGHGDPDSEPVTTWLMIPTRVAAAAESTGIDPDTIAHVFTRISQLPLRTDSHQDVISAVAELCDDALVPGSSASVSLGAPLGPEVLASSSKVAQAADGAQFSTQQGPSQTAWETGDVILVQDLTADGRWPEFARAAAEAGVASALVAPVRVGEEAIGVLSIYNERPHMFVNPAPHLVEMLAEAVGAAIHHITEERRLRDVAAQLEQAMASRSTIEQAKGAVMATQHCTADRAFERLAVESQRRNVKLRDVAAELVAGLEREATT